MNGKSSAAARSTEQRHKQILIGLILGIAFGLSLHPYLDLPWLQFIDSNVLYPIGQIFLRLIFMIVVPMVASALIIGVYELACAHGLGKVAVRTLKYTLIASAASVLIGISLVNLFKPGMGYQLNPDVLEAEKINSLAGKAAQAKTVSQTLIDLIPRNPLESMVRALDGEMIAVMVFALLFGLGLALAFPQKESAASSVSVQRPVLVELFDQIFNSCMKIVEIAMKLAPLAVFSLVFSTAFRFGHEIFISLIYYVLIVLFGLALQQFVIYAILLKKFAGRSPWEFFKLTREVLLYAFATASSNATLPRSLAVAESVLLIPRHISRFVLTVGSTANQNGTALFEGVTVLFLAQVYNIDLSLGQQTQVVLMSILAGVGTAGVPGGSLPLIVILLQQVGIPIEGIGLILGVDRLLDMARTAINVSGDLVIASVISHQESHTSHSGRSKRISAGKAPGKRALS